jgi:hypothetical protein
MKASAQKTCLAPTAALPTADQWVSDGPATGPIISDSKAPSNELNTSV